ncbi:KH domain-containing protein HEN4-like isoform X2 [Abrus precatorius]|uniref:KH domain-containing protein HEN4-like isoform X2 n=1 Tax=Abrus precatorius TaxID=3816 RepID=A0A8B8KQQ9_ABRPR|nr:KH domain-containing protein HEN4-like isoform X2 [Abrus precatorius]
MADPYNKPFNSKHSSHVAFRLLCHASRVGAVIGKSGVLIRTLQETTGARIRIEDAPHDSPDRVILVIAPAAADGDVPEVSKAQEALLKVFERILDVAAETGGTDVGDRVVSCRLLANSAQVGAVIGKAGKVVEKIRIDTGCKIRVLNDNLPACTAPSDEIIEIEGQMTSVKKALVAVSRRLQDCPPVDRTKMMGSRHYEVVQRETFAVPLEPLTNLHIDHRLQRSSASSTLSSRSNGNASRAHTLSAEVNKVSALDPKALPREVTFRILCSNDRVGGIIGKGGSIVRALQNETGATISVGPSVVECEDRLVTITASENPESRYSAAQKAVVLVFSRSVEAGVELGSKKESYVTARLVVPSNQVGCLLGKGGAIVSEMRKATGASVRIIRNDQVLKCISDNDQVVQISGVFSNVQDALYNATGRLRDNLFVSTQNSGGTRSLSSVLADIGPYRRLRDPIPVGDQPNVAVSHSLSRHPLPGLQAQQTVTGINFRGINDVGMGMTFQEGSLELVSGSKTAMVTNTTVEILVPDDVIGCVYGENGSNLARLRQISRAKVVVHEPRPGTSDRIIVISGTPDETQAAQSLLHAFILSGSS